MDKDTTLTPEDIFDMVTELREVYELRTGQTIDDPFALRLALEAALHAAGIEVAA